MKKLFYSITLLTVILYITCHFFIFRIALRQHQVSFKEQILKAGHAVQVIRIFPSQLYSNSPEMEWMDDNTEIRYKNLTYDIVATKNKGTEVLLYVVGDQEQDDLFASFVKQWSDMHKDMADDGDVLTEMLDFDFFLHDTGFNLVLNELTINYPSLSFQLTKGFLSILILPPIL